MNNAYPNPPGFTSENYSDSHKQRIPSLTLGESASYKNNSAKEGIFDMINGYEMSIDYYKHMYAKTPEGNRKDFYKLRMNTEQRDLDDYLSMPHVKEILKPLPKYSLGRMSPTKNTPSAFLGKGGKKTRKARKASHRRNLTKRSRSSLSS
jgi:hypothetical protein